MNMPAAPPPGPEDPKPVNNGGGGNPVNNGGGGNPPPPSADPGPPAILIEFQPAFLLPVTDPDKLAKFVDSIQAAAAAFAVKLQSATGLMLAGPSAVSAVNPPQSASDHTDIVRVGLWVLPSAFPFAAQDPNHPHQLPVLTAASEASGFSDAALLDVPETASVAGAPNSPTAGFAFAIPVTTLNVIAATFLSNIEEEVSKIPTASVGSVTVTCSPPSPIAQAGGTVVTAVKASSALGDASGTITETLGFQAGALTGTMVPEVTGTFSSGTDVGTQVLLGVGLILTGADAVGVPLLLEAIGVTLLVPPFLGGQAGPQLAMISALVNMLPPALPFEPPQDLGLPDFPKLVFEWSTFAATTSEIIGRAAVVVAERPPGSGSVTLSGPASLQCLQGEGGAFGEYTVTWADIAPTSFEWQVDGANESETGSITTRVFPFEQGFQVHFPLKTLTPGDYFFTLTVVATEVDVKNPAQTLTASARQDVIVNLRFNPGPGGGGGHQRP